MLISSPFISVHFPFFRFIPLNPATSPPRSSPHLTCRNFGHSICNFFRLSLHLFDVFTQKSRVFSSFSRHFGTVTAYLIRTRRFDTSLVTMLPCMWIQWKDWMSFQQWALCSWRIRGLSYAQVRLIASQFGINVASDQALATCFKRTACGECWIPGAEGGADLYLCREDELIMYNEIVFGSDELASCPTDYVINYAHELKMQRLQQASIFLRQISCFNLADSLEIHPPPPSRSWLNGFCQRYGLRIKYCEKLDGLRRRTCDRDRIRMWFLQFADVIQSYEPELILNMDETGVTTNRRYKVVVPEGSFSVVPSEKREIHLTAIVTFSATGKCFRPGIILPNLKNLPVELEEFSEDIDFYSTKSGWATKSVFDLYCLNLAHEIQAWRVTLPPRLRNGRVLLLVDGHGSRRTARAVRYLHSFGIDLLTFPGHTTHILQPFDVGIAGVFKGELLRQLQRSGDRLKTRTGPVTSALGLKRWCLVAATIEALQRSLTRNNCRSAFMATGIYPYCPERPLSSHLVLDTAELGAEVGDWINSAYFSPIPNNQAMQILLNSDPDGARVPVHWSMFCGSFSHILTRIRPMVTWTIVDVAQQNNS